jgi:hypothetical protein
MYPLGAPVRRVLSGALKIQRLTAEDRAAIEELMARADSASDVFAPLVDTPAGFKACATYLQDLLDQCQAIVARYKTERTPAPESRA